MGYRVVYRHRNNVLDYGPGMYEETVSTLDEARRNLWLECDDSASASPLLTAVCRIRCAEAEVGEEILFGDTLHKIEEVKP